MEKLIVRLSYWLGIAFLVTGVLWKGVNALGQWMPVAVTRGNSISYWSFFHASILFFVTTIATACHAWVNSQQH